MKNKLILFYIGAVIIAVLGIVSATAKIWQLQQVIDTQVKLITKYDSIVLKQNEYYDILLKYTEACEDLINDYDATNSK